MKGKSMIGIIGAGNHGTLMAMLVAQSNKYNVKLVDTAEEMLSRSHMYMENLLLKRISKGVIDYQDYYSIFSNISVSTDINSVSPSEAVIECINEHQTSKTSLICQLDSIISQNSLLLTTTTSLSLTKLAAASQYPSRVAGLHFFALPTASKIVEIVSGLQTSQETIQKTIEFTETLQKSYALSQDFPGFIANRIMFSFINESISSLAMGVADRSDIDKTLRSVTGMNLGPMEMADEIGLDFVLESLKHFHKETGDDKYKPNPLLVNYVSAGWLGKKSGKGFYDYQNSI
jgi:3-hydroxybutyryl-CoA dehydrogenase